MNPAQYITFDIFKSYPDLVCVFSTRNGGVSTGAYASLNMGLKTGDHQQSVIENRRIFFEKLNIPQVQIAFTDQVHSGNAAYAVGPGILNQTDALITDKENLFLVIQTADCFPVFLYDRKKRAIAAIHAGWQGVLNKIIENTIEKMVRIFDSNPPDIIAAVGPGLQKECFEIRQDLFSRLDQTYLIRHPDNEKRLFDLKNMIQDKLVNQGVKTDNINTTEICTKCDQSNFYSFRRDKNVSGRMFGLIGMRK